MSITYLVTHSGGFHADELLSSVVLKRLYPDAEIVRTRDQEWITPGAGKIIYDVGREYDPEQQIFDHHQRLNPLRDSNDPYSSFGLVWRHFGMQYLRSFDIPDTDVTDIFDSIDRTIVLPIDLMDNGAYSPSTAEPLLSALTLPAMIESLKPVFDDQSEGAEDRCFLEALTIVRTLLEAIVRRKAARRRADAVVLTAIEAAGPSRILELPMGMPFRAAVEAAQADHLLFVVSPREPDWVMSCIRLGGEGFENRADLPLSWAGLTDDALEAVSDVVGAKFCHNGRFIAVANSREAILKMAKLAVLEAEKN